MMYFHFHCEADNTLVELGVASHISFIIFAVGGGGGGVQLVLHSWRLVLSKFGLCY